MYEIRMQIKKEWFNKIAKKQKRNEYRDMTEYWMSRLENVECPFVIRFVNGYKKDAPEIKVKCIKKSKIFNRVYRLRLKY